MKTPARIFQLTLWLLLGLATSVPAFDLDATRDLGCERSGLFARTAAVDLVSFPVGGIEAGATVFELGGVRRYGLSEFDQMYVAVAQRRGAFTLAAGLAQLGHTDFYAEQTAGAALGYHRQRLAVGVNWSARRVLFGDGFESLSCQTVGLSAAVRFGRIAIGLETDNLTEPRLHETAVPFNDIYTLHLELAGPGSYSLSGRVTVEQNERPRFGLGHRMDFDRQASIYWSIATAPLTFAGGCDIMYSGSRLSYTASYHPTLGLSHLFSIGWTFGGKRT